MRQVFLLRTALMREWIEVLKDYVKRIYIWLETWDPTLGIQYGLSQFKIGKKKKVRISFTHCTSKVTEELAKQENYLKTLSILQMQLKDTFAIG